MSNVSDIIDQLKAELESKIRQREGVLDQLKIVDVILDKMDAVITNIDRDAQFHIDQINPTITAVKTAYDARISAGCRSKLEWVAVSTEEHYSSRFDADAEYTTYEVKEIESLKDQNNFHGLKYYSKPADKDYGSTLINDFQGIARAESTVLGIHTSTFDNVNIGVFDYPQFIKVGDSIIDNIENPQIFSSVDIPKVTGLGFTDYVGIVTTLIGGIDAGSNIFRHFGAGSLAGITTLIAAGERIALNEPFVSGNKNPEEVFAVGFATVTGIGTGTQTITYHNQLGITTTDTIDIQTLILSEPASQAVAEQEFTVGIITSIGAYFLDTAAKDSSGITTFFAIRQDADIDAGFDVTANPHSPVKIGILNSGSAGVGHSVYYDKSGDPSGTQRWKPETARPKIKVKKGDDIEAIEEPKVGAGNAPYNIGNFSWPILVDDDGDGNITESYASEGTTLIVSSDDVGAGATSGQSVSTGYASVPPGGSIPGNCGTLDNNISNAESTMNSTIATHEPLARGIQALSATLRKNREQKQLYAWSLLQASRSLKEDIAELTQQISSMQNSDFSKYDN
tara:strand:- start:7527 stop:9227 length:1701 start_codon:yes stop_codon:yes gene_type:complete